MADTRETGSDSQDCLLGCWSLSATAAVGRGEFEARGPRGDKKPAADDQWGAPDQGLDAAEAGSANSMAGVAPLSHAPAPERVGLGKVRNTRTGAGQCHARSSRRMAIGSASCCWRQAQARLDWPGRCHAAGAEAAVAAVLGINSRKQTRCQSRVVDRCGCPSGGGGGELRRASCRVETAASCPLLPSRPRACRHPHSLSGPEKDCRGSNVLDVAGATRVDPWRRSQISLAGSGSDARADLDAAKITTARLQALKP